MNDEKPKPETGKARTTTTTTTHLSRAVLGVAAILLLAFLVDRGLPPRDAGAMLLIMLLLVGL